MVADKWLDEFVEKEMDKPLVLTRLLDEGFEIYGNHSSNRKGNEVYKLDDEIVIYNLLRDKIVCAWNINDYRYEVEND